MKKKKYDEELALLFYQELFQKEVWKQTLKNNVKGIHYKFNSINNFKL